MPMQYSNKSSHDNHAEGVHGDCGGRPCGAGEVPVLGEGEPEQAGGIGRVEMHAQ